MTVMVRSLQVLLFWAIFPASLLAPSVDLCCWEEKVNVTSATSAQAAWTTASGVSAENPSDDADCGEGCADHKCHSCFHSHLVGVLGSSSLSLSIESSSENSTYFDTFIFSDHRRQPYQPPKA